MIDWTPWVAGHPQRIGWFNASPDRMPEVRRYWNGRLWSAPCREDAPHTAFAAAMSEPDWCPPECMQRRDMTEAARRWLAAEGGDPDALHVADALTSEGGDPGSQHPPAHRVIGALRPRAWPWRGP